MRAKNTPKSIRLVVGLMTTALTIIAFQSPLAAQYGGGSGGTGTEGAVPPALALTGVDSGTLALFGALVLMAGMAIVVARPRLTKS